ncbi:MAG: hypothetical protein U1F52_11925 [Burkholderiales bacterium]
MLHLLGVLTIALLAGLAGKPIGRLGEQVIQNSVADSIGPQDPTRIETFLTHQFATCKPLRQASPDPIL